MKQEQSIENNVNESRRGFVDQELGCVGRAGTAQSTAQRGCAGEGIAKYPLVLQLSAASRSSPL